MGSSRMDCRIGFQLGVSFLLVLLVGRSEALWFSWGSTDGTTEAPTLDNEGSGNPVASGKSPKPDNVGEDGAEIIDVASGIRKFVQTWDKNSKATETHKLTTVRSQARNERPMEKDTRWSTSRESKPGKGTSAIWGLDLVSGGGQGLGVGLDFDQDFDLVLNSDPGLNLNLNLVLNLTV